MEFIQDALFYIAGLGAMVMMPIMILVIGLILRVKFSTLFKSALLVGIGFAGINLVVGYFVGGVGPAINQMVETWGLQTDIIDVGWPARAAATWAFPLAPVVILVVLGVNVLSLLIKWSRVVMVDFWSYNHFVFAAAITWYLTDSIPLAIIAAALDAFITFKLAHWTAPIAESYFGLPKISFPTSNSVAWAPLAWGLNKVYDAIPGFRDLKADPQTIQKRFGVFGDPIVMGLVLGALIAILGRQPFASVLIIAMTTAASLYLIPKMMQVLMEGLLPFADAIQEILEKRFKGESFTIGVDAALTLADTAVIATGVLMVPVTLLLAAVLPGNRILPLPDLALMAMWLAAWPVAFSKGNIVRGFITTLICTCILLWIATDLAPIQTSLAVASGFEMPEGVDIVGSQDSGLHLLEWILGRIFALFG